MYSRVWHWLLQGRIQDFKLGGGGALKKIAPSGGRCEKFWGISCEKSRFYDKKIVFFPIEEGGAKNFGVFRVKNHDFTPKNHIFSNFRGARAGCAPPPPPLDPPLLLDLPPLYPCSSAPIWRSPSQFYSFCYTFRFIGTSFYSYICV
jgi:hypothetical protein